MGFPHETVGIPGFWPEIVDEVVALTGDPLADELLAGLAGGASTPGHVCATAFVVSPDRTQLLLVQHPRLGWSNPGGHLAPGESTHAAVLRELAEETGLLADALTGLPGPVAVHVTDVAQRGAEPAHRHWNVAWAFAVDPEVDLIAESDGGTPREVRWFPVDALPTEGAAADLLPTWDLVRRRVLPQQGK